MPTPLAALGIVLAVQEAGEGPGGRQQAIQRGRSLLDRLDQILLEGRVAEGAFGRL